MNKLVLGLFSCLLFSCSEDTESGFSLQGKTSGLKDGTVVYLDNADSQNIDLVDSAVVENESFVFNTNLSSSPLHVVLRTRDYSSYRFLWLEDNPMTFDASQNDFDNAVVTGSKAEDLAQPLRKELETLSEADQREREMSFIKKYPNSIVSAEALSLYSTTYGKEQTKILFELLSEQNKTSKYGRTIQEYLLMPSEPVIGGRFADFEMMDEKGQPRKLSELAGKTILLEFWASWCAPCRKENPSLVKTYHRFKPKGFEIFAVSLDEKSEKWMDAIEKDKLTWHHVNDLKGQASTAALLYGVERIPDSFLIDKYGTIVARDLRGDDLINKLEELLE